MNNELYYLKLSTSIDVEERERIMNYKTSNYNFFFPFVNKNENENGEERVIYNSRTGSLAIIEEDKYDAFNQFVENDAPIEDEEFLADLKTGGYVVEEDTNELDLIRYNLLTARFSNSVLSLTIAPTSDCNFRCVYCYEKDKIRPVTMSEENQDLLIDFVKNNLSSAAKLAITWYGGEPLLALGIIEHLSEQFIKMCDEKNIEYDAQIITNGYLLTPSVLEKLLKFRVKHIQITLDGDAQDHDKRRPLAGGLPTFDKIIDNLCKIKDYDEVSIAIRINADKHNIDRIDNVVKVIREKGLEKIAHPYLAMVENANGTYNDNSCFRKNEFSSFEYDFLIRNNLEVLNHIPAQLKNYCGADYAGGFVINADGFIYKCWSEIGDKNKTIGDLRNGLVANPTLMSHMLYDATADTECKECKFLPVCMGGCPYMRKVNPSIRCTRMKYCLESFMSVIPEILLRQIESAEQ